MNLLESIIGVQKKIKIIVEVETLYSDIVFENPGQFKQLEISELQREHRFKFFIQQLELAKKNKLIDIEKLKVHPSFDKLRTDNLDKIAFELSEK